MEEIKTKFRNLVQKHNNRDLKIPSMGYSDYFTRNPITLREPNETKNPNSTTENQKPDEEIMEEIEDVYFQPDFDSAIYQLRKLTKPNENESTTSEPSLKISCDKIEETMLILRQQQKVLSKKVLQEILEKKSDCNREFQNVDSTEKELQELIWICRKARSYLSFAKTNLTTTSLEVLGDYRKKELMKNLLKTMNSLKDLKATDLEVQKLLAESDYTGALLLILKSKDSIAKLEQYECVQSLNQKFQETYILTEYQLDNCLNEMIYNFDVKKYKNLQEAYKLLNKSLMAMDQLHINFISIIHSSINKVIRNYTPEDTDKKLLFEQQCELISVDKYIPCFLDLCKEFWKILVSYFNIVQWHQNHKMNSQQEHSKKTDTSDEDNPDLYINEKLQKGKFRIWSDMEAKICQYLQTAKNKKFKFDQFIQILSIVQRLRSVGKEFCCSEETTSSKLIETMHSQSDEFFNRYHVACLEEICLFLDNESWTDVSSFSDILQLQEFRSLSFTIKRYSKLPSPEKCEKRSTPAVSDELLSISSKDDRSVYGSSSGYFLRFSEKSSPFDGGLDTTMIEEDILSGIIDESSYYCSEESGDEERNLCAEQSKCQQTPLLICSTALNVLRILGRYLQMCKLLHGISPKIIKSMLDLIYFYAFAVHEIFGRDSPVASEQVYTPNLDGKLKYCVENIVPLIKMWPCLNFSSIKTNELANVDTMYGLAHRIIAIESGTCMVKQFRQLLPYLRHLLPAGNDVLNNSIENFDELFFSLMKPIYLCSTTRMIELEQILGLMAKVKWDLNHVSVHHSSYVDLLNRNCQSFAMLLEEIGKDIRIPLEIIWDNFAHVATHLLVEGWSNAKKCSAAGRQLMQLDFANFMSILELLSKQVFPEHRGYVDSYIKAFYFPPELFEEWIMEQKNRSIYSVKQLLALIMLVCSSDKQKRQKFCELFQNNVK